MEQISSGAEEAASASHETLAVASSTATNLTQARERATLARSRTEALQGQLQPDKCLGQQYQDKTANDRRRWLSLSNSLASKPSILVMLQERLAKFLIKPTCLPLMPPLRPHGRRSWPRVCRRRRRGTGFGRNFGEVWRRAVEAGSKKR